MTTDPSCCSPAAPSGPAVLPAAVDARDARRWNRIAALVLPVVAAVGAVLSWGSLYAAASRALGRGAPSPGGIDLVGAAFPLLVDALILGASARYVGGVKAGRPVAGWRLAAHAGVAGTVLLNADAASGLGQVPWHVTAPIVWSVLVELVARDVLGQLRAVGTARRPDRIPARLWVTAPGESARISWRMARTGVGDVAAARADTERAAAARDQLALLLPGRARARIRRRIAARLRTGALDPALLAHLIDTTDPADPTGLHRTVLRAVATGHHDTPTAVVPPGTSRAVPPAVGTSRGPGSALGSAPGSSPGPVRPEDAQILAEIVAAGAVPGVQRIRSAYGVGHGRAVRLRGLATDALTGRPREPEAVS